jgi:transposase
MGAKIPSPIKAEIIRKWLQGISRDQIANEAQIGTGTVSGIINEGRKKRYSIRSIMRSCCEPQEEWVEYRIICTFG